MEITGIIVEYNPFHNGHKYHIEKTGSLTNCEGIIAVISGNFVQRGAPSIVDKWTKTKMALLNGVDLVLELPALYSLSSAEFFAYGAVSLLENLGVVKNLCFGSECEDIKLLTLMGKILYEEPEELKLTLKEKLHQGMSYASARGNALKEFLCRKYPLKNNSITEILHLPNNILAIEYCKSLARLKSTINPVSIKRIGEPYNSTYINNRFSSATSIRNFLKENNSPQELEKALPYNILCILRDLSHFNYKFTFEDSLLPYLKYKNLFYGKNIKYLPDVSEGLENRIESALKNASSYDQIINYTKTKRYAYSRISRILCQFFLGFENLDTKALRKNRCPYARVLGFNNKGTEILKKIKQNSSIPVYTKLPKNVNDVLKLDLMATKGYSLLNKNIAFNQDYISSPLIMDKI
ncbi:nucleotidyltransferase [Clostridium kluyveri]|uniref:nucleotidyltransferase n=1 Tax=Clostridium kluyveri TaxID=1534 RepID=UPI002246555C|nr:nucleotidyltransferase [Clostridium kluyveri]UZQ51075.1 nucleotidyltransferase [Clostridium kluyveri]